MAIDVTNKILSDIMLGYRHRDENTSITLWLINNIGPLLPEPDMEIIPTGANHRIHSCGKGWAIDYRNVEIPNRVKVEDHNIGICAPLGPWKATITMSQYHLHIADDTIAVQFKLRWSQ